MPFDQSTLTQMQKDAYNAGKGLPKGFNVTYLPQQWTQNQTLGGNDQTLYNQSQATQLGLSGMAVDALGRVNTAINESIAPTIQVQGGPEATAGAMTTNIGSGGGLDAGRATGFADQDQVKRFVDNAGPISGTIANAGAINGAIANAGAIKSDIAGAGTASGGIDAAGSINRDIANAGKINTNIADAGRIALR